jgi:hypothetical protein
MFDLVKLEEISHESTQSSPILRPHTAPAAAGTATTTSSNGITEWVNALQLPRGGWEDGGACHPSLGASCLKEGLPVS